MSAVGSPKSIIHEDISELAKLVSERNHISFVSRHLFPIRPKTFALLCGVKAKILQKHHTTFPSTFHALFHAPALLDEFYLMFQKIFNCRRYRCERKLRHLPTARTP